MGEVSVCCHLQPEMTPVHLFLQGLMVPPLVVWGGGRVLLSACNSSCHNPLVF